ncbi:hypothetical protein AB0I49_21805 [Streptomyces sp. NPDC050617]|uniref:hypothetical protein n=1 Tax=Streptomyces sp. NPDC050617 TaxID=3154628 RepID=UPI00343FD228
MADEATNWDQRLAVFADGDAQPLDRNKVAGPGSEKWIANYQPGALIELGAKPQLDVWWSYNYAVSIGSSTSGSRGAFALGLNYDWSKFGNDSGALVDFTGGSDKILNSVNPNGNQVASPQSLDDAADMLTAMETLIGQWQGQFGKWATEIGGSDSDLQGEAAGLFRATMEAAQRSLKDTQDYLLNGAVAQALRNSGNQLRQTTSSLQNTFWAFMNDRLSMPVNHLHDVFFEAMNSMPPLAGTAVPWDQNATDFLSEKLVSPTYGSPKDPAFWDKIENEAKKRWLDNVRDKLDTPSAGPMQQLSSSYFTTAGQFRPINTAFTLQLNKDDSQTYLTPKDSGGGATPPGSGSTPPPGGGAMSPDDVNPFTGGNDGNKGADQQGDLPPGGKGTGGGDADLDGTNPLGEGGDGKNPLGGGDGGKNPADGEGGDGKQGDAGAQAALMHFNNGQGGDSLQNKLAEQNKGGAGAGAGTGTGIGLGPNSGGTGGGTTALSPKGEQLRDKDGNPITLPPGAKVDPKTGAVTDRDGKAVMGPDKKPLVLPKGSKTGPLGGGEGGGGTNGPNNAKNAANQAEEAERQLRRLQTSVNTSGGGGFGAGDHTVGYDEHGNLVLPKGAKVDAHGNLVGADGKPLTNPYGSKLSVPPGSKINSDGTITDPRGKSITESSGGLKARNPANGEETWNPPRRLSTGSSAESGLTSPKGVGSGLRRMVDSNGNTVGETGVSTGISRRARAAMGEEGAQQAQEMRAAQAAAAESRAMGRAGSGSSTPMVPPMGGGAGGGGGQSGDRQRNVWLAEDEEVWGTDPDIAPGVIGR